MLQETYKRIGLALYADWSFNLSSFDGCFEESWPLTWVADPCKGLLRLLTIFHRGSQDLLLAIPFVLVAG